LEELLASALSWLQREVGRWLSTFEYEQGWRWWTWSEWTPQRPEGVVQVLTGVDGEAVYGRADQLNALLEDSIFHWEWSSGDVFHFYIEDFTYPEVAAYVKDQQQLDWIRGLVAPELAAVHREVFDWAAENGTSLGSLGWREFEELIAAAFAGQGMTTTLGSGRSDGGIDLRLVRHAVFGDVMTAVQVKSGQTPVRLHYIQALAAASVADGNSESIFVTASRYLPGAKKWAEAWEKKTRHRIHLATPTDVEEWCAAARDRIWLPDHGLKDPKPMGSGNLVGRIMIRYARYASRNSFGLVVRQTRRAVLLQVLPSRIVSGDFQIGLEAPATGAMTQASADLLPARSLDGEIPLDTSKASLFDTEGEIWSLWKREPIAFNTMD
jgi:Restriction endonuclease